MGVESPSLALTILPSKLPSSDFFHCAFVSRGFELWLRNQGLWLLKSLAFERNPNPRAEEQSAGHGASACAPGR